MVYHQKNAKISQLQRLRPKCSRRLLVSSTLICLHFCERGERTCPVQDMSSPIQKIKSKTTPKKMAEVELREGHESVTCAAMLEIISWGYQSSFLVKPFFLFLLSHNPFLA